MLYGFKYCEEDPLINDSIAPHESQYPSLELTIRCEAYDERSWIETQVYNVVFLSEQFPSSHCVLQPTVYEIGEIKIEFSTLVLLYQKMLFLFNFINHI